MRRIFGPNRALTGALAALTAQARTMRRRGIAGIMRAE